MTKHTRFTLPRLSRKSLQNIAMGIACSFVAFGVGLETAGDVHPFDTSEAAVTQDSEALPGMAVKGDLDGDGALTIDDAILSLTFANGFDMPAIEDIHSGDMDGDFQLTTKDTLRILHALRS